MKLSSWLIVALCAGVALPAAAQGRANNMRFQAMDRNGDGVITRDEWRGNDKSFRNQDWNGDGKLSGDEVRPGARRPTGVEDRFAALDTNNDGRVTRGEWQGTAAVFNALDGNRDGVLTRAEALGSDTGARDEFRSVDVNGDGVITRNEWHWNAAAFDRLDSNGDGRLSGAEFESPPADDLTKESAAYRAGYERGRQEGIQAGKEDKPRHWDLEGQRELETADSGYEARLGDYAQYQAGYRAGFRRGYPEGFGPR